MYSSDKSNKSIEYVILYYNCSFVSESSNNMIDQYYFLIIIEVQESTLACQTVSFANNYLLYTSV